MSPARLGGRAAARAVDRHGRRRRPARRAASRWPTPSTCPLLPGQASDRATEGLRDAKAPGRHDRIGGSTSGGSGSGLHRWPSGRPSARREGPPGQSHEVRVVERVDRHRVETATSTGTSSPSRPPRAPTSRVSARPTRPATTPPTASPSTAPRSTALATEAGGADRIAAYCVALIGEPEGDRQADRQAHADRQADRQAHADGPAHRHGQARPTSRRRQASHRHGPADRHRPADRQAQSWQAHRQAGPRPARVAERTPQLPVPDRKRPRSAEPGSACP